MKRENNHGEGGHVCPSFLQRKHNRECTLRKRRKKRHRRKACMGMKMEMPDSATFISGDICFFCGGASWIWHLLSVSE